MINTNLYYYIIYHNNLYSVARLHDIINVVGCGGLEVIVKIRSCA